MGFNTVGDTSYSGIDNRIVNQIHVDGTNVKVLPAGTPPSVVYRIGDGTIHPEGWDNIDGEEYLDFYISTGEKGSIGNTGEQGIQGFQGIQGIQGLQGATGAAGENGKTPIYEFTYNDITGDLEYEVVGYNPLETTQPVQEW